MATKNNPVIGYRECPDCGQRGSVHKVGGSRNQLYQRCGCGCVQSNGPLVQSRFWYETKWLDDGAPVMPPMVLERAEYEKEIARVAASNFERVPSRGDRGDLESKGVADELPDDFEPAAPVANGPIGQTKKKGGGLFIIATIGAGIIAIAMGA